MIVIDVFNEKIFKVVYQHGHNLLKRIKIHIKKIIEMNEINRMLSEFFFLISFLEMRELRFYSFIIRSLIADGEPLISYLKIKFIAHCVC